MQLSGDYLQLTRRLSWSEAMWSTYIWCYSQANFWQRSLRQNANYPQITRQIKHYTVDSTSKLLYDGRQSKRGKTSDLKYGIRNRFLDSLVGSKILLHAHGHPLTEPQSSDMLQVNGRQMRTHEHCPATRRASHCSFNEWLTCCNLQYRVADN